MILVSSLQPRMFFYSTFQVEVMGKKRHLPHLQAANHMAALAQVEEVGYKA